MAKKGKLDMTFVVDTSKPSKNIKELQTRIEKLRNTIEGAPLGSAEFERLTGQLSNASSEMKVLEKNMEGLEPQQKAEAFLKMGEGIAGAFAVSQGAMGLFGVESENMEKIQVKVQSAIAIATGIRMMSEAALMAGIAKRVIVEKLAMVQTKAGIVWTKGIALAQGAWAVMQGVLTGTIVGSTLALHALKAAIIATGIGALVIGVVSLVAAMSSWFGSSEEQTISQEDLKGAVDELKQGIKDQLEASRDLADHNRELSNLDNERDKTLLNLNRKLKEQIKLTTEENDALAHLEGAKKSLEIQAGREIKRYDRTISKIEARIKAGRKLEEQLKDQMEVQRELLDSENEAEKEAEANRAASRSRGRARSNQKKTDAESLRKLENELLLLEIQDLEERAQLKREQDLANELAGAEKIRDKTIRLETLANIQDIYDQEELNRLQKIEDDKLKIINDAKDAADKLDEELQKSQTEATDAYLKELELKNMEARARELKLAEEHYKEMGLAEGLTDGEKLKLKTDYLAQVKEVNRVFDEEEKDIAQAKIDKDKEDADEVLAAKLDTLSSSLDAISANMDARVSELDNAMNRELEMEGVTEEQKKTINEKYQKKKDAIAKRQKAISAAQAIISTYMSAVAAYSAVIGIVPVGPVLAPIAAGAAIAAGLASVRQIYAQDVGGGGGGGGGGSSPPPSPAAPKTGSFTLSGQVDKEKTIKAYVVTDDMTDSQSQLEDIRETSTI